MWQLDHLAVVADDLEQGTAWVEEALGVPLQAGGQHVRYGTHNTLLGLEDGLYLEVIAPDPTLDPVPVRWFGLGQTVGAPHLGNWICRADDLGAAIAQSPAAVGTAVAMERGDLRWQIAVPADGSLPFGGAWPTLIEWAKGTLHPASRLAQQGVRLRRLTIATPQAAELSAQLLPRLASDLIGFETAPEFSMTAVFATAHGERVLA
jgi:catechol 2,3-dioxygenase-like lactoylglutathione lyase family enzyme